MTYTYAICIYHNSISIHHATIEPRFFSYYGRYVVSFISSTPIVFPPVVNVTYNDDKMMWTYLRDCVSHYMSQASIINAQIHVHGKSKNYDRSVSLQEQLDAFDRAVRWQAFIDLVKVVLLFIFIVLGFYIIRKTIDYGSTLL